MRVPGPYQYVVGSLCCGAALPDCTLLSAPAQYKITGLTGITDTGFDCGDCEDFNIDPLLVTYVGNQFSGTPGEGGEQCIWENPADSPCAGSPANPTLLSALLIFPIALSDFTSITFMLGVTEGVTPTALAKWSASEEFWDPLSSTTLNLSQVFPAAYCDDEPSTVTLQPA